MEINSNQQSLEELENATIGHLKQIEDIEQDTPFNSENSDNSDNTNHATFESMEDSEDEDDDILNVKKEEPQNIKKEEPKIEQSEEEKPSILRASFINNAELSSLSYYDRERLSRMKLSLLYIKCCIAVLRPNSPTFPKQNELHRWLDSKNHPPLTRIDIVCIHKI